MSMESNSARKEAIRKFKEQKVKAGCYAVRCTTNGHVWVGSSRNLEATRNSTWFSLRINSHLDKSLQHEWTKYDGQGFEYEILEELDPDTPRLSVSDLLKEKSQDWRTRLTARPLP